MNARQIIERLKQERVGLVILCIFWVLFFGRVFISGNVFFLDDLKIIYYPLEHEYASFQADFDLPLWSNTFGFGHPLLAWGQLGFFTPLHVVLRLLQIHPVTLLQASIAVYFLVGLLGMYAFLRHRKYSLPASVLGATLFTWNGFSIGHLNHVNFYTGIMLLPLLLIASYAFIRKPTVARALGITLAMSAITLSAQPQVVLFTAIGAAVISLGYIVSQRFSIADLTKRLGIIVATGALTFLLSSTSILPLFEFIPETERATPLPRSQLLEFSYPPSHAITLLLPYFYGDHDHYWGAKGFQELAAFIGLIPLVLIGGSIPFFRRLSIEGKVGWILILVAIIFATGRYSPIYSQLIEHQVITTFGVAGRFVFFFVLGSILLTPAAFDLAMSLRKKRQKMRFALFAAITPLVLLVPFFRLLVRSTPELRQMKALFASLDVYLLTVLITIAILLYVSTRWIWSNYSIKNQVTTFFIPIFACLTLLLYSWHYNPVVPAARAYNFSPFTDELIKYRENTGIPPRLYSREELIQATQLQERNTRYTDPISPEFAVYQPILLDGTENGCFTLPLRPAEEFAQADITIGLHSDPRLPAQLTKTAPAYLITGSAQQTYCFDLNTMKHSNVVWLSLTSNGYSSVVLPYIAEREENNQAYFTRKQTLTDREWEQSQKPYRIEITTQQESQYDTEGALLARHLQVAAGTSGARWIGALSIREYRNFIEQFFANDQEPFDGDNIHAIVRNRNLLNLAGVTHLAQVVSSDEVDAMETAGFIFESEARTDNQIARLYSNPQALPKVFLVPGGEWKAAADETRHAMTAKDFDPQKLVYLSGTKPPETLLSPNRDIRYSTEITNYQPTQVDIAVTTDQPAYLILTDSTTPQWQTYINNTPAPHLVANSIFKAAEVPAGEHTVSFRYRSPATDLAKKLSLSGLAITLMILIIPRARRYSI